MHYDQATRAYIPVPLAPGRDAPPKADTNDIEAFSRLVNLTPHSIDVIVDSTIVMSIPPEPVPALIADDEPAPMEPIADVPVIAITAGRLTGLAEPEPGVAYVVSRLSAMAAEGRNDVFFPEPLVRNDRNQVIGCAGLARFAN